MVRRLRAKISRVLGPAQACPATSVPLGLAVPIIARWADPVTEDPDGGLALSWPTGLTEWGEGDEAWRSQLLPGKDPEERLPPSTSGDLLEPGIRCKVLLVVLLVLWNMAWHTWEPLLRLAIWWEDAAGLSMGALAHCPARRCTGHRSKAGLRPVSESRITGSYLSNSLLFLGPRWLRS